MTTETASPDTRALRPATTKALTPPAPGAFSAKGDPQLAQMKTGGAFGTSMLALYPVFACVIVVLTSLSMAGPSVPV